MIHNTSKKTVITNAWKKATGFFENATGLLTISPREAILLQTRFGIHTFFLREPIDVLVLNNKHQVVKIKTNLKPNSILLWNPTYCLVLELPKNTVQNSKIDVGDHISFDDL